MKSFLQENTEGEILGLVMPYIKKLCRGKWLNLEPDDCVSEAAYFFICVFRSLPIGSGHLMSDYKAALISYMNEQNRKAPPRYYGHNCSLDDHMVTNNVVGEWTLYDILAGPSTDETIINVDSFLKSLSAWQKDILQDLMTCGLTKAAVARKYGLSDRELKKVLLQIGSDYQQNRWSEK